MDQGAKRPDGVSYSKDSLRRLLSFSLLGTGQELAFQLISTAVWIGAWGVPLYSEWLLIALVPNLLARGNVGVFHVAATEMLTKNSEHELDLVARTYQTLKQSQIILTILLVVVWAMLSAAILGMSVFSELSILEVGSIAGLFSLQFMLFQKAQILTALLKSHGEAAAAFNYQNSFRLVFILIFVTLPFILGPLHCLAICLCSQSLLVLHMHLRWKEMFRHLHKPEHDIQRTDVFLLLRQGLESSSFSFGQIFIGFSSIWYLGLAASPEVGATFSAMRTLTRTPVLLAKAIEQSLRVQLTRSIGQGEIAEAVRRYHVGMVVVGSLTVVAVCAMLVAGPRIFEVWTLGRLSIDVEAFYALAVGAGVFSVASYALVVQFSLNKFRRAATCLVLLIASVACLLLLVRPEGMVPVAYLMLAIDLVFSVFVIVDARSLLAQRNR